MNPEAHNILKEMQDISHQYDNVPDPISATRRNTFQLFQMARIQVLIAEAQELSANKLEHLTRRLMFLTWCLLILTASILIFTFALVRLH
jgi:hypothetical protein